MRRQLSIATLGAWVALAPGASADEFHYEDNRFGQRAMAMGGAVTAYPDEPEAIYYNPAGLVLTPGIKFSGSLQLVRSQSVVVEDALRERRLLTPENIRSSALSFAPTSTVLSTTIDKRHAIALGSFVLSDTNEAFSGIVEGSSGRTDGFANVRLFLDESRRDTITFIGPTYALKLTERLSLGVSVYYAAHERRQSSGRRLSGTPPGAASNAPSNDFILTEVSGNSFDGALLARLGAYYRPTRAWSMGLACSSRSVSLHGNGSFDAALTVSQFPPPDGPPAFLEQNLRGVTTRTQYPWSCRVGAAVRAKPSLALTYDISAQLPARYNRFDFPDDFEDQGVLAALFPRRVEREPVVNYGAGVEWFVTPRWPMRAGAFTNFSAAPEIGPVPTAIQAPDVDLFGGTLSSGFVGEDFSLNVGGEFQGGSGDWAVLVDLEAAANGEAVLVRTTRRERRFMFFVSGVAKFAEKITEDIPIVKKKREKEEEEE